MITEIHKQKYRPEFHFSPESNWMNDPNGMVYFNGEYHLFYQHHPHGTTWGPMHWGHAVSRDLVTWEHRPVALSPDEHGMIFSGSAVVDWKDTSGFFGGRSGLVAVFTHNGLEPETGRVRQRQSLAFSADSGRSWIKYAGNPVLENDKLIDFRDPKVFWHDSTQSWVMILASGQTVCIYHSPNLKDWAFASEFGEGVGSHDGVWECPDLFPLQVDGDPGRTKWVMLVSIGDDPAFPEGSRTQIFTGEFDGRTFKSDEASEKVRWLDFGRDNYAGVSWSDIPAEDGRRIYIGWMSNWKYANLTPTEGWRSAMTLPRELLLKKGPAGIRLIQKPVAELRKLRLQGLRWEDAAVTPGDNMLSDVQGGVYEMECEIELGDVEEIGFKLRKSDREETVVGYNTVTETLFVDRSSSGEFGFHEAFPCKHGAQLALENGRIKLHIFVDQSSIEVFANDGEVVITDQIFPMPSSTGLELYVQGGKAKIISLAFHPLKSQDDH